MNIKSQNQDIDNIYIKDNLIKRLEEINSELNLKLKLGFDANIQLSDNQIKSFITHSIYCKMEQSI